MGGLDIVAVDKDGNVKQDFHSNKKTAKSEESEK